MIAVINGITVHFGADTAMKCVAFKDALLVGADADDVHPP